MTGPTPDDTAPTRRPTGSHSPGQNGSCAPFRQRSKQYDRAGRQLVWIGRAMVAAAAFKVLATAAIGLRFDPAQTGFAAAFALAGGLVWARGLFGPPRSGR